VPSVAGGCWGECVELKTCGYLDGCELCEAKDLVCLRWETESENFFHCAGPREQLDECDPASCKCLGPDVCGPLTCVDFASGVVTCLALEADEDEGEPTPPDEAAAPPAEPQPGSTPPTPAPDPDAPPSDVVATPEPGSYLYGRGTECGLCGWTNCDREIAACLGSAECSEWNGCLLFCAGLTGDAQASCQLDCFHGDPALLRRTLDTLACLVNDCCKECGAPCP
jgi:hypothetical protein